MGDVILSAIKRYTILLILFMTIILFIAIHVAWGETNNEFDEQEMRVKINQLIYLLEDQDASDFSKVEFEFPYCVVNSKGVIQISTITKYQKGEQIDVHTLGGAKNYLVPINQNESDMNLLYVDCKGARSNAAFIKFKVILSVMGIIWLLFLVVIKHIHKLLKRDIMEPIQELHHTTKEILLGNYKEGITYDFDGELGSLCHDFELMRDELADSHDREVRLREKVHIMYASISHDLKTPLAIINGYLEGILYDVVQSQEEIKDYANRMLQKSQMLNQLIDDILKHAKSELNQLSINKQEIYARDYFEKLLKEYAFDTKQNDFQFSYQLPENVIITIDPNRIAEVLQNLIGNAMKYRREIAKIEVTFEEIENPQKMLLINVKDNGTGIDATDLPFVFDMFYRGNKARTQDIPGSGLGLNISKYIIEQHGGQIECDSIAGVGTTISFTIPFES